MTMYTKSEICAGIFMEKDCADAIIRKSPGSGEAPTLSEIHQRLDAVRKKIAVLAQVVGQRK